MDRRRVPELSHVPDHLNQRCGGKTKKSAGHRYVNTASKRPGLHNDTRTAGGTAQRKVLKNPSSTSKIETRPHPRPEKRRGAARPPGKAEGGLAAPRHARVAGAAPYPPTACAAVLSAMAGLTAEFGMGSGDPCLHGRARDGRATGPGLDPRGPTLGAAWRSGREEGAHAGGPRAAGARAPSRGRSREIRWTMRSARYATSRVARHTRGPRRAQLPERGGHTRSHSEPGS